MKSSQIDSGPIWANQRSVKHVTTNLNHHWPFRLCHKKRITPKIPDTNCWNLLLMVQKFNCTIADIPLFTGVYTSFWWLTLGYLDLSTVSSTWDVLALQVPLSSWLVGTPGRFFGAFCNRSIYMYIFIYIYTHIYTYVHVYIYMIYEYVYIDRYIFEYTNVYIYTYMYLLELREFFWIAVF